MTIRLIINPSRKITFTKLENTFTKVSLKVTLSDSRDQTYLFIGMKSVISVYAPKDIDPEKLFNLTQILRREAETLNLEFKGPYESEDERVMVYYEDDEVRTFIYIDDYKNELDPERIRVTIRVLSLIAMHKEEEIIIDTI